MLKKPKKGGVIKRLQAEAAAEQFESFLAFFLLTQLAWGILTTAQIQEIAHHSLKDMRQAGVNDEQFPELHRLAKAGTWGKNPNNLHRDMSKHVDERGSLKPFSTCLPFKGFSDQPTHMTLPHQQFAHLYSQSPDVFKSHFVPAPAELPKFWESVQDSEAAKAIPDLDDRDFRNHAVPLGLHGDDVPITGLGKVWSKQCLTFEFYSLMLAATGAPTTDLMMWIWGVFHTVVAEGVGGTIDCFMEILKWSFEALYTGKWPTHDWRGVQTLAC